MKHCSILVYTVLIKKLTNPISKAMDLKIRCDLIVV